jgi:16S rRNA (guanine1207-N2)-methyltransferase
MTNEQYFEPKPSSASEPVAIRIALPDGTLRLTTDRGVFSYGALDTGTKVLLLKSPPLPKQGHLLDLGCGTGAIAITMAKRSPEATVWAVDVNSRALRLCRDNARANGVTNVQTCTPEEMDDHIRLAAIWSNPPIHIGKQAMHEMLLHWLTRLTPDGEAVMVVQRHLGSDSLQTWLTAQGYPTERLGSAKGYRLLRSVRGAQVPPATA